MLAFSEIELRNKNLVLYNFSNIGLLIAHIYNLKYDENFVYLCETQFSMGEDNEYLTWFSTKWAFICFIS